jgi:hypothetical protein
MKDDVTVACFLTDKELRQRRQEHLDRMAAFLEEVSEIPTGFKYTFRLESDTLEQLITIIELERNCCPFLNFDLSQRAGESSVSLALTGPEGTKEAIKSLFNWN